MTAPFARIVSTLAVLGVMAFWGLMGGASQPGGELADPAIACDLDPPRDVVGLEACLARAPQDVELLLDLAAAYEAAGRLADAVSAYQRAVGADARDAEARLGLATALLRGGDVEGARREGTVALELRPTDPMALALASSEAGVAVDPQ